MVVSSELLVVRRGSGEVLDTFPRFAPVVKIIGNPRTVWGKAVEVLKLKLKSLAISSVPLCKIEVSILVTEGFVVFEALSGLRVVFTLND